jgi:hypothetical protein
VMFDQVRAIGDVHHVAVVDELDDCLAARQRL